MPERDWSEIVESERLAVDEEFSNRLAESRFSRSEWGLIMTVVEFDIRDPEDPDRARLVGDTSKVESVLPELEKVGQPPVGGGTPSPEDSGGILERVTDLLGLGTGDDEVLEAADELVAAYAERLQARLEAEGKWEDARLAASD